MAAPSCERVSPGEQVAHCELKFYDVNITKTQYFNESIVKGDHLMQFLECPPSSDFPDYMVSTNVAFLHYPLPALLHFHLVELRCLWH